MLVKSKDKAMAKDVKGRGKGLLVKHVMVLDTEDGAFTDDSVKVKPDRKDPSRVVFKCVDAGRLLTALSRAGLCAARVVRGRKHYVAWVDAQEFQTALSDLQEAQVLPQASKQKQIGG